MSSVICEAGRNLVAVFAVGLAIKLMDDHLDAVEDTDAEGNLATRLGRGVSAYALLSYAVAAWLNPTWALTFFLASYACGMLGSSTWWLPSGLPAWTETALVLLLGFAWAGWREMGSATAFVLGIQLLDDVIDLSRDGYAMRVNLAHRWGKVEATLAGVTLVLVALLLAGAKTLLALLALPLVLYCAAAPGRGKGEKV